MAITAAAAPHLPDRIPSTTNPSYNTWLSASAIAKGDKELRKTLATEAAFASADRTRAAYSRTLAGKSLEPVGAVSSSSCIEFSLSTPPDRRQASDTLMNLTKGSKSIFVGDVEALEPGFFQGVPTTLLRVTPTEWIRSDDSLRRTAFFLVPYPVARFHINDGLFCGGAPEDPIPAVGQRIVVFVAPEAVGAYFPMLIVAPQEVVFAQPNGHLALAGALRHDPAIQAVDALPTLVDVLRRAEKQR